MISFPEFFFFGLVGLFVFVFLPLKILSLLYGLFDADTPNYIPGGGDPWKGHIHDDDYLTGRAGRVNIPHAEPPPEPVDNRTIFEKIFGVKEEDFVPCDMNWDDVFQKHQEPHRTGGSRKTQDIPHTDTPPNAKKKPVHKPERRQTAPQIEAPNYSKIVKEFLAGCRGMDKRDITRKAAVEFHPDRLPDGMKPYGEEIFKRVGQELEKWS